MVIDYRTPSIQELASLCIVGQDVFAVRRQDAEYQGCKKPFIMVDGVACFYADSFPTGQDEVLYRKHSASLV